MEMVTYVPKTAAAPLGLMKPGIRRLPWDCTSALVLLVKASLTAVRAVAGRQGSTGCKHPASANLDRTVTKRGGRATQTRLPCWIATDLFWQSLLGCAMTMLRFKTAVDLMKFFWVFFDDWFDEAGSAGPQCWNGRWVGRHLGA